jgi:hypothetical protein
MSRRRKVATLPSARKARSRRVLLDRPSAALPEDAWVREWRRANARPWREYPIVRLTAEGVNWGVMPEPGDEIGYAMDTYRTDTCMQAATATATQVPIEQVPDPDLDTRFRRGDDIDEINLAAWTRFARWADRRGLKMLLWSQDEVPVPRRRWIGVAETERPEPEFVDHCVVMAFDRLIFDPICGVKPPAGHEIRSFGPADITYGISFDNKEN